MTGPHPPSDGQVYDNRCARCGSSVDFTICDACAGDGVVDDEIEPDWDEYCECECDVCCGSGGWWTCLSSIEWCENHPLKGRENIPRGQIEWFTAVCGGKDGTMNLQKMTRQEATVWLETLAREIREDTTINEVSVSVQRGNDLAPEPGTSFMKGTPNGTGTITIHVNGGAQQRDRTEEVMSEAVAKMMQGEQP